MKHAMLTAILFFAVGSLCPLYAMKTDVETIRWQLRITDPHAGGNPIRRAQMVFPKTWIDGHTLYFEYMPSEATLSLYTTDGVSIFETVVSEGETHVELPSDHEGCFKMTLVNSDRTMYSYIQL